MDARRTLRLTDAVSKLSELIEKTTPTPLDTPSDVLTCIQTNRDAHIRKIRELQEDITAFNIIQNFFHPSVSFIPNEILREIFCYIFDSCCTPYTYRNRDFLHAAATCRQWRDVATSVPRFWTCIRINEPVYTAAALERSRNQPISLVLEEGSCKNIGEVARLLQPHAHRIKALHADFSKVEWLQEFCAKLREPAPMLEDLRISHFGDCDNTVNISSLFSAQIPSLRKLHLLRTWMKPPAASDWAENLVELSLNNSEADILEIVEILQSAYKLEMLSFEGYIPWLDLDEYTEKPTIDLPFLKELVIKTSPILDCDVFLYCLHVPEEATLQFVVNVPTESHTEGNHNIPNMFGMENIQCIQNLKKLEILGEPFGTINIRGYKDVKGAGKPNFVFQLEDADSLANIPSQGRWPINTTDVEMLVIKMGVTDVCFSSWDILYDFPLLKTLHLILPDVVSVSGLFNVLARYPRGVEVREGEERFRFCPALETVEVSDFVWHPEHERLMKNMIMLRRAQGEKALRAVNIVGAEGAPSLVCVPPKREEDADVVVTVS